MMTMTIEVMAKAAVNDTIHLLMDTVEYAVKSVGSETTETNGTFLSFYITMIVGIGTSIGGLFVWGIFLKKTRKNEKNEEIKSCENNVTDVRSMTAADKFLLAKREEEIEKLNGRIQSLKNELVLSVNEYNENLKKQQADLQQKFEMTLRDREREIFELRERLQDLESQNRKEIEMLTRKHACEIQMFKGKLQTVDAEWMKKCEEQRTLVERHANKRVHELKDLHKKEMEELKMKYEKEIDESVKLGKYLKNELLSKEREIEDYKLKIKDILKL